MDEFVPQPTDEQPLTYEILMDEVHEVEFEPDSSSDEDDESEKLVEPDSGDESEELSVEQEDEAQLDGGCIQCEEPTDSLVRYCDDCLGNRRSWLPERPATWRSKDCVAHKEECPSSRGVRGSCDAALEAPTQNASVDGCSPNDQGQEHPLPQALNARDPPPGSIDIQSMQPGTSGTQPIAQQSAETPKWPPGWSPGGDRSSKGGTSIKDKDFIAVQDKLCALCCREPKNACLIHGKVSHQVCCYRCAKKLFKKKDSRCPVCRRQIEKITRNIIP